MSCKPTYKGKRYNSLEELKSYLQNNSQEINFLEALEKDNAIGNPFGPYGQYKTEAGRVAVEEFISWMIGEKHTDKLQDYRQAIINKIPELKGKPILYYKDLGRPSHATALDYLINKYDWNKQQPNTVEQNVKGIEINSYQIGLGNDLTNVHYTNSQYPKSKYPIVPTNKDLKLTQAAKTKWGESVEAWYKSNNAQTKGIPEGEQGDKYDFDLMVGLITDKLTQYPNLVEQINQNGGLAFLQASTHTMGTGRWSSKNPKNMFMNSLIQAYKNVVKQSETKDTQITKKETKTACEGGLNI